MWNLFTKSDEIAGISTNSKLARNLERIAFSFLVLMVISAPHSIAASQTSFILGILASIARLFVQPRVRLVKTPLDLALLLFFGWAVVISIFAYDPIVSASKLRGASLFLVFYFVINNIRNLRSLRFLVFALILSSMVSALWTPIERVFGRGVEIHGLAPDSALKKALLWEGDALLAAGGKRIETPDQLVQELERSEKTKVDFYRPDFYFSVVINRADLGGGDALQKLGIKSWNKSRNWRAQGFFSHYVTFAGVLQMIASLVFGLFIVSVSSRIKNGGPNGVKSIISRYFPFSFSPLLFFCLAAMAFALLLTVTRASQLSFLISAAVIVLLFGNRKIILTLAVIALPVALAGLFFLQQSRQVGFFDTTDDSTSYRQTIYREGLGLWLDNPRHFIFGVGMDQVKNKEFVEKWRLFDNGKLPVSHFHSTPVQMLVERGLPGLLLWVLVLAAIFRTLFRGFRGPDLSELRSPAENNVPQFSFYELIRPPFQTGVILGSFGAAAGMATSSIVHYNFGDGEVVLVFYLILAFGVFAAIHSPETDQPEKSG